MDSRLSFVLKLLRRPIEILQRTIKPLTVNVSFLAINLLTSVSPKQRNAAKHARIKLNSNHSIAASLGKIYGWHRMSKKIPLHVMNYAGYKTPFVPDAREEFVYIHT